MNTNKILGCVLLVLVTAGLYARVGSFPFLDPSDDFLYVGNSHLQNGLTADALTYAFTAMDLGYPTPLTLLSYAFDFEVHGSDPGLFHTTNLLLHLLNVLLLFLILAHATRAPGRSFLVAALFAIHPLNVESVAWIAERKNVLCTFFFLLALMAYGWYVKKPTVKRYLTVALLFVLALLSKPMAISLPFVLLLWDYWPLQRVEKLSRLVLEKVYLLPLCAASAVSSILGQRHIIQHAATKVGFEGRLLNSIYSYVIYIRQAVWPTGLMMDYSFPLEPLNATAIAKFGCAVLFLAAVSVLVWKQRKTRRYLLTGWLWFLVTLIPMSGVLWLGDYSHADRYCYIPLIGIFVMVVWSAAEYADREKIGLEVRMSIAVTILAFLSLLTSRQVLYWESSAALWKHAIAVDPGNLQVRSELASIVYNQALANAVREEAVQTPEQQEETKRILDRELKAYRDAEIQRNAAEAQQRASRHDHPQLEIELAAQLTAAQRPAEAVNELRKALTYSHDPLLSSVIYERMTEAFRLAGDAASQEDALGRARDSYRQAFNANPDRTAKLTQQLKASGFDLDSLK